MRKQTAVLIGIIIVVFISINGANANMINAQSCSQSDVESAINSAMSGDTVLIPAGTATWYTTVEIPNTKKITLVGAGYNNTVITSTTPSATINLNKSGSRVTGFCFIITGSGYGVRTNGHGWRVDNCKFENVTDSNEMAVYSAGGSADDHPTGLIDHCVFENARVLVLGDLSLLAHEIWAEALGLGTNNAVFIEDCEFTYTQRGNCIDSNYGGRYVFRYNTVNDTTTEAHSLQGDHRASRSWEIYENTFNQVSRAMWAPMYQRGGTGVIFNNTVTGIWTTPHIIIDNKRSCESLGPGGRCNGSSSWDGNEPGEDGYPCRDQIGRSTDQWLWTAENPYPPQVLDPTYCWNNKHGEDDVIFHEFGCDEGKSHLQEDRDYYNNVQKPGYAPYTYPHPMIQAWGNGEVPSQPKNVRIKE